MIQVIDLIETNDVEATKTLWRQVGLFLAEQPGYVSGTLLETFETVHPTADYKLTSFCQWETDEDWQRARSAAKANPVLSKLLAESEAKFTAFKGVLHDGHDTSEGTQGHQNMVLVDVIQLSNERMDGYAAMWQNAKNFMKDKHGYVAANLYRTVDEDNPIKFINMPEWISPDLFTGSLKTPEFFSIVDEYKEDFALYLSKKVMSIPARSVALKKAV